MSEKDIENSTVENISSSNIFDEFSTDSSLVDEVEKLKEEAKKDMFYYFGIAGKILQNVFVIFLILTIIGYVYLYVQKNQNIYDKAVLDPFCFILGKSGVETPEGTIYCSSIAYSKNFYDGKLEQLKNDQAIKILENITRIYEEGNFLKTKEVSFLLNKKTDRVYILKVLEEFDKLKNDFTGIDKRKIQCSSLNINSDEKSLTMTCSSFSQGYERGIIGFSGMKNSAETGGTSISIANSFLNYIEKNSKQFNLIDKQKVFNSTSISGEKNGYTNKTVFELKLKINF